LPLLRAAPIVVHSVGEQIQWGIVSLKIVEPVEIRTLSVGASPCNAMFLYAYHHAPRSDATLLTAK
jgi:hypothetical protein